MGNVRRGKKGSDAARVSWRPRHRELPVYGGSTISKLMRREIGGLNGRTPPLPDVAFCAEKFRRFNLEKEFHIQADMEFHWPLMPCSIRKIIPANDFIFVIASNGISVAFHQTRNDSIAPYKKDGGIWYFKEDGEFMKTLFYNKINDSIITVYSSVFRSGYNMRAIPLEDIRRHDDWGHGIQVFGSWTDNLPIFDSFNNLAITFLYQDRRKVNNIYETNSHQLVHSLPGEIHCITTRPGIMIVAYSILGSYVPIKVFSTEKWIVLQEFIYPLPRFKMLQFVGLCSENLLLKEKGQNLQVNDLWNYGKVTNIRNSEHETPSSSLDLIASNVLLELTNNTVVTCNSRGEQVRLLEDIHNDSNRSCFHVNLTRDKNFAILYSWKTLENPSKGIDNRHGSYNGAINICSTFNGKSIVEVIPCDNLDLPDANSEDSANNRTGVVQSSADEALKKVTALFYDEEHHRIYTGNTSGVVHVWST